MQSGKIIWDHYIKNVKKKKKANEHKNDQNYWWNKKYSFDIEIGEEILS
jgi:hypothetical protein